MGTTHEPARNLISHIVARPRKKQKTPAQHQRKDTEDGLGSAPVSSKGNSTTDGLLSKKYLYHLVSSTTVTNNDLTPSIHPPPTDYLVETSSACSSRLKNALRLEKAADVRELGPRHPNQHRGFDEGAPHEPRAGLLHVCSAKCRHEDSEGNLRGNKTKHATREWAVVSAHGAKRERGSHVRT